MTGIADARMESAADQAKSFTKVVANVRIGKEPSIGYERQSVRGPSRSVEWPDLGTFPRNSFQDQTARLN